MTSVVDKIQKHIDRIGLGHADVGPCSSVVVGGDGEDGIRRGFVRVYDDYVSECCRAQDLLDWLAGLPGAWASDEAGWEAFWQELPTVSAELAAAD